MATNEVHGWNHHNVYCQTGIEAEDELARMLQEYHGKAEWSTVKILEGTPLYKAGWRFRVTRKYLY